MSSRTIAVMPEGKKALCVPAGTFTLPVIPHEVPVHASQPKPASRKGNGRTGQKKEVSLNRDAVFELWTDDTCHIVSERYFYKTLTYYSILRHELEGRRVCPSSRGVLDASVVPVFLEKARLAGIPVCEWGISQGYTPLPAILYGLNYYPTASEFRVVSDPNEAKEAIRHITNKGKYPFCYQPLDEGASIQSCTSIFGRTTQACPEITEIARQVYGLLMLPLVSLVMVHDARGYRLSSLSAVRYSHMTPDERAMLGAAITHQELP